MADRNEIREVLQEWLENPAWKSYYEDAPSDRCRDFIALEFFYSDTEDEETAREMDAVEAELAAEDLRHLVLYAGNNPRKAALLRRIAALESGE